VSEREQATVKDERREKKRSTQKSKAPNQKHATTNNTLLLRLALSFFTCLLIVFFIPSTSTSITLCLCAPSLLPPFLSPPFPHSFKASSHLHLPPPRNPSPPPSLPPSLPPSPILPPLRMRLEKPQTLLAAIIVTTQHTPGDLQKSLKIVLDHPRATRPELARVVEDGPGGMVAVWVEKGREEKKKKGKREKSVRVRALVLGGGGGREGRKVGLEMYVPAGRRVVLLHLIPLLTALIQTRRRPIRLNRAFGRGLLH